MAARKRRIRQSDDIRAKIQAGLLMKHLTEHAVGQREMSQTQIKAAEILLKKTLPDLKQTEIVGDADNPVAHEHKWQIEVVDKNA